MKQTKVSFIVPAHNEGKIIGKTLSNLNKLPYSEYEVLVGLDGCTDNTEKIVKSFSLESKKFKYFKLKTRSGKPEVVDYLVKKSKGEIIIINDADWIFSFRDKKVLEKFLSIFKNKEIGGIAESFPVEWDDNKLKNSNIWYKVVAYGNYFWIKYQKDNFVENVGDLSYIKESAMFLTNIFRKKLYKKNSSLGDDFERTRDIKNKGFQVVTFKEENIPRMVAVYNEIRFNDIFKQKIRTGVARNQLDKKGEDLKKYQFSAGRYIMFNSWKNGFYSGLYSNLWLLITVLGSVIAKFKKTNTKQGWLLRAERK